MIDLHTHILPGLDDGSGSWRESYEMAELAADSGVTTICCTHHANIPGFYKNYNSRAIEERFEELEDRLIEGEFPIRLLRGMEIYATDDVVEHIMRRELISINHSGFYLIEFAFEESPEFMIDTVRDILNYCGTPLIAHPERYYAVQDQPELIRTFIEMGAFTQVNKGSLLGNFGHLEEETGIWMMDHDLVTCVASDAHRSTFRTTDMGRIKRWITENYSPEKAKLLLHDNPALIIDGKKPVHVLEAKEE